MSSTLAMLFTIFFLLSPLSSVAPQGRLKGFELLDNFYSGYVPSGDSIVQAVSPFSPQLSICYWFYQPWARASGNKGSFELRTTLTEKNRDLPSNLNWPNVYAGILFIQSVHYYELKKKTPTINFTIR